MTKAKSTEAEKAAGPEHANETERKDISDSRQPFMGHDFLRRNLLVLLPPAVQRVTRPVN